jgi:hypothetical protein
MIEPPMATTRDPLGSENHPARRIAADAAADDPITSSRQSHTQPPAHAVPTGATIDRHHFAREITRTVERVREIPAPLLAQAPLPKVVPFTGTPMPPPRNPAREPEHREEPTEVHVHIGRIEVTAAPEPAAPKKTRPAPRETRPLADYLARKGRA